MCGILGVFNFHKSEFAESDFIQATEIVSHRGPDNLGYFSNSKCFLGHTRLSIIGIGEASNQPFYYENLIMVFNGEIFNYIELRDELSDLGYQFITTSDTEVVIKAFHKWGGMCFSKFNGMWSLIIYDQNQNTLIASRDRFGQKPMFVLQKGDTIFFASEVQQLVPFSDRKIDFELVEMFLKEGTYQGNGRTFFISISEFPKAHYCVCDSAGNLKNNRYWDYWQGDIHEVDDDSFADFNALLQDAIKLRNRADVPFSILLSGGIDSTIVAAYSAKFHDGSNPIPAFNYKSADRDDESIYAKIVADKLGLPLIIREQENNPTEYRDRLKQLVQHMGRGHSSPAIVSVDYLYESVASKGIRVAIDGQGADEMLCGYKTYFPMLFFLFLIKGQFRQAFYCLKDFYKFGIVFGIILFMRITLPPPGKRLMEWIYGYGQLFKPYKDDCVKPSIHESDHGYKNRDALNRFLIHAHRLGLENLLFYGDIVSMKNSVENRSPFLDHRLIDFVFSRSTKLKYWNGMNKYALRLLPVYGTFKEVLDRKKIGFSSSIGENIKLSMIEELRNSPILDWPIFSKKIRIRLQEKCFASPRYERLLFRLYQVHLWSEIFNS
jgi:asparagine synthase (glutamine-hydrolysing)